MNREGMERRAPESRATRARIQEASDRVAALARERDAVQEVLSQMRADEAALRGRLLDEHEEQQRLAEEVARNENLIIKLEAQAAELAERTRSTNEEGTAIERDAHDVGSQAARLERYIRDLEAHLATLQVACEHARDRVTRMGFRLRSMHLEEAVELPTKRRLEDE